MIWGGAWIADYPEGENFAQLLYRAQFGSGQSQLLTSPKPMMHFIHKQWRSHRLSVCHFMKNSVVKLKPIIHRLFITVRIRNWLLHPQVQGFKAHPMMNTNWQYLDIQPIKNN